MNKPSLATPLSLLGLCLLLSACAGNPGAVDSGITPPAAWHSAERAASQATNQRWWTHFGSPSLNRLIDQARRDSFDVAAAMARVRQAQATAVIAGAGAEQQAQSEQGKRCGKGGFIHWSMP